MDRKCNIIADNGCESVIAGIKPKLTEENLIEISNKGIYKRGVKDADSVESAEISFASGFLHVKFSGNEVNIKEDFKGVLCSCQSKTVCRHIITALIILKECDVEEVKLPEKKEIVAEEVSEEPDIAADKKSISIDRKYLEDVLEFLYSVMKKGVINCNETDIDIAVQFSLKAENTVHGNISLMLRSFSVDIAGMLSASAGFSAIDTFHLIARLHNTICAVLRNEGSYEKLRMLCSESGGYESMGVKEFVGLGAYPWSTKSGYTGVTALLYCIDDKKIYTYSSALAYIHEKTKEFSDIKNLSKTYKSHSHWQNLVSLMQISRSDFRLFNGKSNPSGRISSSKESVMHIAGGTTSAVLEGNGVLKELSAEKCIEAGNSYEYFSSGVTEKVCVICAEKFESIFYSGTEQVLKFVLSDGENAYPCEIQWSEQNKGAISHIESIAKKKAVTRFFVCRYLNDIFVPVSIVGNDGINNFYFD